MSRHRTRRCRQSVLRLANVGDACRYGDLKFQLTLCRQRGGEEGAILEEMKKNQMPRTRLGLTAGLKTVAGKKKEKIFLSFLFSWQELPSVKYGVDYKSMMRGCKP